jgi:hypothetical protein
MNTPERDTAKHHRLRTYIIRPQYVGAANGMGWGSLTYIGVVPVPPFTGRVMGVMGIF